ncbi:MAG: hypothetical protein OXC31_11950 [Spirochaetaceae bacterium]|nr:hypothetical protein [Spirochaetaceae bacterium]
MVRFKLPSESRYHAILLQLVGELVQMGLSAQNDPLPGGVDRLCSDGPAAIAPSRVGEARFLSQRVDHPRLAGRQLPYRLQGRFGEPLSGLGGVLDEQRAHLGLGEVPDAQ